MYAGDREGIVHVVHGPNFDHDDKYLLWPNECESTVDLHGTLWYLRQRRTHINYSTNV